MADEIHEVSDEDAFSGMIELWEKGVTLIPDSPERYEGYLRRHLKEVTGDSFSSYVEIHRELSDQSKKERKNI
ncbi:hypothetical protein AKJ45_03540 [candidate division MSBL1 archaeon SCGC-AAA261F19]|uniref:Uncharacterized protein n=2 Tax=candidate division MSBL1 TaxID=215777 RepID=A0A133V7M2_9EURY|nr:hypothetical protein AKJ45_03540 [candidate division MSBL1 archaeon SCGC-AAA261F19]KXB02670.1 hypothetical protein AKJ43_01080 [candidate division MSBL1 archaeon SCGC-AAA261D19]